MRFRPVFTPAGAVFAAAAGVLLIRSLSARNAYEIALSAGALGVSLLLGGVGAWGAKRLGALEPAWKPAVPLCAGAEGGAVITGFALRIPWFFRIHCIVGGMFFPVGDARFCRGSVETSVPRGSDTARLELGFPVSGVFRGEISCRLRDIFGLFSFHCGVPQERTLTILSAPALKRDGYIVAVSGAEDQRTRNASDEERYYMREYAPGDRFRDINWKSSDRIDTLITRISPDNQEKVSRIAIYFRNFGPRGKKEALSPALRDLWLLDRAKARLTQFLRSAKEEQPAYIFEVHTADNAWELKDDADIASFLDDLGRLPFVSPRNETPLAVPGALYVFSTSCDAGLSAFLTARQPLGTVLFFVRPPAQNTPGDMVQSLRISSFPAKGFSLPRTCFAVKPQKIPNTPNLPGMKTEIDYAELRW